MVIDTFCAVSAIAFPTTSGRGRTCKSACSDNTKRRYCPLALEKRAVTKQIIMIILIKGKELYLSV